ncbi:MAG TPA: hypothetical protein VFY54_17045 [Rubrobacter sp.]|nr:hypothetical protein [Rubrobacter sp.]
MDEQEAIDALWSARQEDMGERETPAPRASQPEQVESAPDATEQVTEGTTDESDSFTQYGPDDLPPELLPYYDSMLADYRRKTQELASEREQFEEIGGFETAREAVEFATQLQTDPNYAYQVYQGLRVALESAGMSPEEASIEANRQVNEAASVEEPWDETEAYDEGPDITPLQNKLNELEQWREQVEQEREMEQHAFELQRQEAAILASNPNYSEEDMDDIYALAWNFGGDLLEAEKHFKSMNDRFFQTYLDRKASVPTGLDTPGSSAPAQIPEKFNSLDEAHEAAVARLRTVLEEQGS